MRSSVSLRLEGSAAEDYLREYQRRVDHDGSMMRRLSTVYRRVSIELTTRGYTGGNNQTSITDIGFSAGGCGLEQPARMVSSG